MSFNAIHLRRLLTVLALVSITAVGLGQPGLARDSHQDRYGDEYDYDEEEYDDEYEDYTDQTGQTTTGLTQPAALIGACRYSPNQLDVYADAARTRQILTILPDTEVTLTGVVGTGVAEISAPALGWIETARVEPCTDATEPPPDPNEQACYEILTTVTVRTGPSTNFTGIGQIRQGGIAYATTNPPREVSNNGRIWIEIYFPRQGQGWFALTGPSGTGQNAARLPNRECE